MSVGRVFDTIILYKCLICSSSKELKESVYMQVVFQWAKGQSGYRNPLNFFAVAYFGILLCVNLLSFLWHYRCTSHWLSIVANFQEVDVDLLFHLHTSRVLMQCPTLLPTDFCIHCNTTLGVSFYIRYKFDPCFFHC